MSLCSPGLSRFTLPSVASSFGHLPFGDTATPRGIASDTVTVIERRPVALLRTTSSPSASPRAAASAGWSETRTGPSLLATPGSFAKLSFINQLEAGDSRRRALFAGRASTVGRGTGGKPSASARADAISTRPLGVGNSSPANWMIGSEEKNTLPFDASDRKSSPICALRSTVSMMSASLSYSSGSAKSIFLARRRNISEFGRHSPMGSVALTWAPMVRLK